ncbi:MAG: hypothetical protein ABSH51_07935 [Solirubrobacteraceae bacterium]|jgi:hypothetical protein
MNTFPDSHRDLLDAQVASLATIGVNGFPQLTSIGTSPPLAAVILAAPTR